jgi:hypothetical protein
MDEELNLDNITLDDCIALHELKGKAVVINDGKVVGIEDEDVL